MIITNKSLVGGAPAGSGTYCRGSALKRLVASLLCGSMCAALALPQPAAAQSGEPPQTRSVDENGVDLIHGAFVFSLTEGSIGDDNGGISSVRWWDSDNSVRENWTGNFRRVSGTATSGVFQVLFGQFSEQFTGNFGAYTPVRPTGSTLVSIGGGALRYTTRDGIEIDFAPRAPSVVQNISHAPVKVRRADGMTYAIEWDTYIDCGTSTTPCKPGYGWLRLRSVTSSANYKMTVSYVQETHPSGGTPPQNWRRRSMVQFQNLAAPIGSPPTVTYAYPSADVVDITVPGGGTWKLTSSIDGLTGIRRPGETTDSTSVAYGSNGVTSTVIDGVTTTYSRSVTPPVGGFSQSTITKTDALSQSSTFVADLQVGALTSVTNAASQVTAITNDSDGRPTRITHPEGNYVVYTRDSRGNVTQTRFRDKAGNASNDIVTSATYAASCSGNVACDEPLSTTDARGNTTDYTYDATHGGILTATLPAATSGAVRPQIRFTYGTQTAVSGQPVYLLTSVSACQTTASCAGTADESKTTYTYTSGNLLPEVVTAQNGSGTLVATTTLGYDARGNLTTSNGPLSGTDDTTTFRYDADRRRVGAISPDPDGGGSLKRRAERTTYDAAGRPTVTEQGTVTGTSDGDWSGFAPAQAVTSTWANNRISTTVLTSGSTTYSVAQYSYDTLGRLDCEAVRMNPSTWSSLPTSACTLGTTGSAGPDRIQKVTYDVLGRMSKTQPAYGTADQADDQTLTYSTNGKLASITDAEGNKTTYTYDGHDRLSRTSYPVLAPGAGTSSSVNYEQLGYDGNGNVVSRQLRDGNSITYIYDALNRVIYKDTPNLAYLEWDVAYEYDLLSRPTRATGNGWAVNAFAYDALGRMTTEQNYNATTYHAYDLAGRRTRLTWYDGFYVDYDYNVLGDVTAIRENGATSGAGVLATYAYDDLGRRTGVTRGNGTSTSYSHDAVSRLTSLSHNVSGTSYDVSSTISYKPASQIASRTRDNDGYAWTGRYNVDRAYAHDGLNQVIAAGAVSIGQDGRGNTNAIGSDNYVYTSENRLSLAPTTTFVYEPAGGQILQLYNSGTSSDTRFAWSGLDAIAEIDGATWTLTKRYVPGPVIDEPVVEYAGSGSGARTWLHADERGSIIARSDGSGVVTNANSYDEYGIPASTNTGRFQYTGQMWLPEAGLQYSKARNYSPELGRFLQADPAGYGDGMNLYAYVGGDPVNARDPLGLQCMVVTGSRIKRCGTKLKETLRALGVWVNEVPLSSPGGGIYFERGGAYDYRANPDPQTDAEWWVVARTYTFHQWGSPAVSLVPNQPVAAATTDRCGNRIGVNSRNYAIPPGYSSAGMRGNRYVRDSAGKVQINPNYAAARRASEGISWTGVSLDLTQIGAGALGGSVLAGTGGAVVNWKEIAAGIAGAVGAGATAGKELTSMPGCSTSK